MVLVTAQLRLGKYHLDVDVLTMPDEERWVDSVFALRGPGIDLQRDARFWTPEWASWDRRLQALLTHTAPARLADLEGNLELKIELRSADFVVAVDLRMPDGLDGAARFERTCARSSIEAFHAQVRDLVAAFPAG
ncbi:MAG: hypothetical protein ABMB14_39720 [Myxococcota bacterium]